MFRSVLAEVVDGVRSTAEGDLHTIPPQPARGRYAWNVPP